MSETLIKVGIKTSGKPETKRYKTYNLVSNMLIGDSFHWQKTIEARLPGELFSYEQKLNYRNSSNRCIDGKITLINILPLEKYLECVVGSEMNPSAPIEFLKAHSVISRNWALGKIKNLHNYGQQEKIDNPSTLVGWDDNASHIGFDVCSDDHCQRYQGLQHIDPHNLEAIKETADEVLIDSAGNLIDTRFSKCCGGKTELFSSCWQPVNPLSLESFSDPWCDLSPLSENQRNKLLTSILKDYDLNTQGYGFRWEKEISKKDIKERLNQSFGRNIGEIKNLEILHRGPSGRIDLLRLHGSEGILDIGKELWIRRILSPSHLYSSAFDLQDYGSYVKLSGKGWGHGVGLCQIGAANMADRGFKYNEILEFYYPGSSLIKINN